MKPVTKENVIRDLCRIQKRIWRLNIAAENGEQYNEQLEIMRFAVSAVDDVIGHINDLLEA